MKLTTMKRLTVALVILCAAIRTYAVSNTIDLASGFLDPPDSTRPWVYWFFMDGNLSQEGMTADLEAMQAAGIGGVIIMEVNVGIPRGPVEFMSEEWCALFKHAVEEAERLGLEITLNAGPGWTGSGGPWVKAEQSMQHLVASATEVEGPAKFDAVLPQPEPRPPYFGESGLPAEMLQARKDFYGDVAVLAFPRVDASRLADIDEKALYVREPYTSKPGVKPYLPAPATHPTLPSNKVISTKEIVDLTDRLQPDGRLAWDVPEGAWTILRFGRRNTGANTRPAPQPGLGLESNKFDRAALEAHFDAFIGKLLLTVGSRPAERTTGWTMLHIDSWEMGAQNWTVGFAQEFERRRGYSPLSYLPAMTGRVIESVETSERFLWDLRLTAQELVIENHAGHLKELGRRHGFGLSIEPYDMNPTSDMVLGGVADVPMCEFWSHGLGFDSAFTCFEAASVAHTLGRPIVAAEAFTAGSKEAWQLYPAAMKNQGDWALCTGINRFVFHRFAHQPWLDRQPGMTMGPYGVHWDRTQTWWPTASAYHRYLARCQFLLRPGVTVADICYLVPEGAPHVFRPPASALEGELLDRRGYNFDGCAPNTLLAGAKVEDGRVTLPGGAAYRLLVLPAFDTMTPALLRKIKELVGAGATVVGPPPRKSPSLSDYPRCDEEVRSIATALWGDLEHPSSVVERNWGKGKIIWGGGLAVVTPGEATSSSPGKVPDLYPEYEATARILTEMGLPPDFETGGPLRYTHRRTSDGDFYFVANRSAESVALPCRFRVSGYQPEIWDPLSGSIRDLPEFIETEGCTEVPLRFEPYQSFFIVFRKESAGRSETVSPKANFPAVTQVSEIDGPWDVSFDAALGGPERVRFETLRDWREHPEPGIRYYSGIATYSGTFDLPEMARAISGRLLLDIGEVHGMARVRLNGQDLGGVWCAPWTVDITHAVRPTKNRLEIDVANLWPNRLIGDKALEAGQEIAWTTWNPYKADSPLLESGLRGPVQIVAEDSFPMVDYHVHLKGGLTLEEAKTWALTRGLRYGIAQNCGVGFPVTDDAGLLAYVENMRGQGVCVGMQAEGREWVEMFSPEAIAQFDYILSDAMTWRDDEGNRMRLWMREEVIVDDPESFMEMLVDRTVWILENEPIDLYANPTFLPAELAGRYDELWTAERVGRVIDAAVRNDVAIEISAGLKLPKPSFIKRAKAAGATFSFGTNNGGKRDLGDLEYCRQMIAECGLTPADMFVPKPDGQKAIQRKPLPKRKY